MVLSNYLFKTIANCLLLFCATETNTNGALQERQCKVDVLRLPRRIKPIHYELQFKIDMNEMKYTGEVVIDVEFDRYAQSRDIGCRGKYALSLACNLANIVLHANKNIAIKEVNFIDTKSGLPIVVRDVCRDPDGSHLVVSLTNEFKSAGKLRISFSGKVNTEGDLGLYESGYVNAHNEDGSMVVTQFESGHARRTFPCFDEPILKATFGLTIEHAKGLKALSNTPPMEEQIVRYESDTNDYIEVKFERTPIMSTYLLAFVVGQFDHVESLSQDGKMTIGMWTPPGRADDVRETLLHAVKSYNILSDYFKIDQPIRKIDFVAVDKFSGGMENWGLVTIETKYMLAGVKENNIAKDESFRRYLFPHELAHHWFGNLVTMKWWDDLWLNEGFADWISAKVTDKLMPELGGDLNYLVKTKILALETDSDPSKTHPIKNLQLKTVEEIEESFDTITYQKAHCVIRMLDDYLGEKAFNLGVHNYVTKHSFNNTDSDDLWAALTEASGLDVDPLMDSWIYQAGFPLVEVDQTGSEKSLKLSQRKFSSPTKKKTLTKWRIPISIFVSNGASKTLMIKLLLDDYEKEVKLPRWFDAQKPGHWLKVNSNFVGFYRVHYKDPRILKTLQAPIENKIMSPADRLNILDDAKALYANSLIDEQELLEILSWFKEENNEAVIIALVNLLSNTFSDTEKVSDVYMIIKDYYQNIGGVSSVRGNQELKNDAEAEVLGFLLKQNYQMAVRDSINLYESTRGDVPIHLREKIYPIVATEGSDEQLIELLDRIYQIVADEEERIELLSTIEGELKGTDKLKTFYEYLSKSDA